MAGEREIGRRRRRTGRDMLQVVKEGGERRGGMWVCESGLKDKRDGGEGTCSPAGGGREGTRALGTGKIAGAEGPVAVGPLAE